jgi:hypothetical protein
MQPELTQLLRLVEAAELPTTGCRVRRYLEPDGGEGSEQVMPQRFTCAAIQPPAMGPNRRSLERERHDSNPLASL